MVSTRGVKVKFFEGERVLCYEPDPTKAKVLYDSKVLGVIAKKDARGKKLVEYMIHFQGWNSSWDRSVSEEYVLKDTPENRQLQRDLAEKSQLHIGAYLYRKERKKHTPGRGGKSSDKATPSSEDGSCGSPAMMEDVDGHQTSSSSEDESSEEEVLVPIELNQTLKNHLEVDFYKIKTHNKLHKLPSSPNVVQILEEYWKHYATKLFMSLNEKPSHRPRQSLNNGIKLKPEDIQRKLTICKEVLDGLRVHFDFHLNQILLYSPEDNQIETVPTKAVALADNAIKTEVKTEEDQEYAHLPIVEDDDQMHADTDNFSSIRTTRRRTLRSNKSNDANLNGNSNSESSKPKANIPNANNHVEINGMGLKIPTWKVIPEYAYAQNPPPPCLVYGVTHLLRLFVKLPEILSTSSLPDEKMKLVTEYLHDILGYITERADWLQNIPYIDAS